MKRNSFWFLMLSLTFASCTVYKEYPIDIYKPGEIAIPPNVENIALIARNANDRQALA